MLGPQIQGRRGGRAGFEKDIVEGAAQEPGGSSEVRGEARSQQESAQLRAMVQRKAGQGSFSDMDGEHLAKELWPMRESSQSAVAKARQAIEQEQEGGHALGECKDRGVARFVEIESPCSEGVGEQERLTKGHGKAFAGDGVGGSGCIADEGDIAAGDAAQAAGEGEGAALGCGDGSTGKFFPKEGKAGENLRETHAGMTGDGGDAHLLGSHRRDVGLTE